MEAIKEAVSHLMVDEGPSRVIPRALPPPLVNRDEKATVPLLTNPDIPILTQGLAKLEGELIQGHVLMKDGGISDEILFIL